MSDPTPTPALPLDFPPLLAAAEEMAREAHNLFAMLTWGVEDGWSELDDDAQATLVQVHAHLLADLTRPASRSFWREWLGRRVGLDVSGGVTWKRDESGAWTLSAGGAALVFCPDFCGSGALPPTWDGVRYAPAPTGMAGATDPAAALLTALLATEPR